MARFSDKTTGWRRGFRRLPAGIWALGFGSLLMDTSSELVHSLLPVFLSTTLGASIVTIGLIEGIAEASVALTKLFSGAMSDKLRRRKPLVILGYGLSACVKPLFPLAPSVGWIFGARLVDRVGKGIRGAPRDALVAEIAPAELRGAAYGLRQSLDSVGAFLGPLLALGSLLVFAQNMRVAMWIAVIPAVAAVLVLALFIREPDRTTSWSSGVSIRVGLLRQIPGRFWLLIALGVVFTLARFSEAFLILRAESVGLDLAWIPLVLIVMNIAYAIGAYPAGALADSIPPRGLLLVGLLLLIAADALLALSQSAALVLAGSVLWGVHMAFTQGLFAKLVADAAPPHIRGTAFGLYNMATGAALLAASVIAGSLWDMFGPAVTFITGGGFAVLALFGLLFYSDDPSARTTR